MNLLSPICSCHQYYCSHGSRQKFPENKKTKNTYFEVKRSFRPTAFVPSPRKVVLASNSPPPFRDWSVRQVPANVAMTKPGSGPSTAHTAWNIQLLLNNSTTPRGWGCGGWCTCSCIHFYLSYQCKHCLQSVYNTDSTSIRSQPLSINTSNFFFKQILFCPRCVEKKTFMKLSCQNSNFFLLSVCCNII